MQQVLGEMLLKQECLKPVQALKGRNCAALFQGPDCMASEVRTVVLGQIVCGHHTVGLGVLQD